MALITTEMAMGSHAFFVREGDAFAAGLDPLGNVLGAGVTGVSAIPAANDAAWMDLGTVDDWEDSMKDEEKPVYIPSPGHLVRKRIITTKQDLDIKLVTSSVSFLVMEAFYRSKAVLNAASGQFTPLGSVPRQGFLKLQRYSDTDVLILSADLWVQLKVTAGMKGGGGNITLPEFMAAVLYSGLNSMALG